jgi:AcrR family transcriptional regulator
VPVESWHDLTAMPEARTQALHAVRSLRSDAAANRERVLAAATIAIKRDGEKVPMAEIAAHAGVGIGTLYRHYPTRARLLDDLSERSYRLVLEHARLAAASRGSAAAALTRFFEQTISARDDLILPLHGGPVSLDESVVAVRAQISDLLEQVLDRGRADGTIRPDVTAIDIIITGAMLAQPLPHTPNWDRLARRQAAIYVAGLSAGNTKPLPGRRPTRAQLEAGFEQAQPGPSSSQRARTARRKPTASG